MKDSGNTTRHIYDRKEKVSRAVFTAILAIYSLFTVFMLFMTVVDSFKTKQQLINSTFGFPSHITLENYKYVLFHDNFGGNFLNSVIVTGLSVFGTIILASTTAYGLTRYKFKYSKLIIAYFLLGMMLPIQLKLIPLYSILKNLGLINSLSGLILVYISNLSLPVFILSAFFRTLPEELQEAARVDGASEFRTFHAIMLPMAKPVISAVSLLTAFTLWNDFFLPLVIISNRHKMTLPLLINNYTSTLLESWNFLFAAVTLTLLPIVIIFVFFSEKIVSGISNGAVKG